MGRAPRKLLGLVQWAALAVALFFLGLTPGTQAGGQLYETAVETHHAQLHAERGRGGDEISALSHCHPGLDCSLVAVMVGGPELIARSAQFTREPNFNDLALLGGEPSFDPPPPRRVSRGHTDPIRKPNETRRI